MAQRVLQFRDLGGLGVRCPACMWCTRALEPLMHGMGLAYETSWAGTPRQPPWLGTVDLGWKQLSRMPCAPPVPCFHSTCREDLAVGDQVQVLPCNAADGKHVFHPPCLAPWLAENNSCPTCR